MSENLQPQRQPAALAPLDESALLAGDPAQLDLLQKRCIAHGGTGSVQVGKYVINIQHGTNVTIGDGVAPAELLKTVQDALEAVCASDALASLMQYLEAVKAIRVLGQSLLPDDLSDHSHFVALRAESRDFTTGEAESTSVRDLLLMRPNGDSPSLWLYGQPGCGKTTLLRHLARCAWYAPESVGLSEPHLPLYVRLSCVSQAEGAYIGETLKSALGKTRDITTRRPIGEDFLETWPQKMNGAKWLLLFDGMDEVPTQSREAVYQWIGRVLDMGFRAVVTSRPLTKPPPLLLKRLKTYSLEGLSSAEQAELARTLLGGHGTRLLQELEKPGREWLRQSPLMFSLAAFSYDSEAGLPARRVDLYRDVTEKFLDQAARRATGHDVVPECAPFAKEALEAIALSMSFDQAKVGVNDVRPAVATMLAETMASGKSPKYFDSLIGTNFIQSLGRHSGVFEVLGESCGWLHPTFREFFAASFLARYSPAAAESRALFERAADPSWRQILLMLLTLWSDDHNVDDRYVELAASGPDGALMAAQALLEGACVSQEAELRGMQLLCDAVHSDAKRSVCSALLTRGYEETKERLRVFKELAALKDFKAAFRALTVRFQEECRALHQKETGNHLGYIPQWFEYLEKLEARDELEELAFDRSLPVLTRAIALSFRAKLKPRVDLEKFSALLAAVRETPTSTAIVVRMYVELGDLRSAEAVVGVANCGWNEAKESLDLLRKANATLSFDRMKRDLHPRFALAAWYGELERKCAVSEELWDALLGAIVRFSAADPKPHAAPGFVPCEAMSRLVTVDRVMADAGLIRAVLDYSAHEDAIVATARALAKRATVGQYTEWVERRELTGLAFVLLTEGLIARHLEIDLRQVYALAMGCPEFAAPDAEILPLCAFVRGRYQYVFHEIEKARENFTTAAAQRESSIRYADAVVEVNSGDPAARLLATIAEHHDGNREAALKLLDDYIAAGPAAPATHAARADLRFDFDNFIGAVEDYSIAIDGHSLSVESMGRFADSMRLTGDYKQALGLAELCTSGDGEYRARQVAGAAALVLEAPTAIPHLTRAIEMEVEGAFPYLQLAYAQRLLGNTDAAVDDAQRFLELSPDDFDAQVLLAELAISSNGPIPEDKWGLIEAERDDVSIFVEVARSRTWTSPELDRLRAAVRVAYADALEDPKQITHEALTHLIVYTTLCEDLGKPMDLLDRLLAAGRLDRAVWTVLPLCRMLSRTCPRARTNADDAILRILKAIGDAGGNTSWLDAGGLQLRIFPEPRSYSCPMYCSKAFIGGLESHYRICSEILKNKAPRQSNAILLVRLDKDSRVYGQCNFKHHPEMEFNLKFSEELSTLLHKNLPTFVFGHGVGHLLFLEEILKAKCDAALRRGSMPVRTMMVKV